MDINDMSKEEIVCACANLAMTIAGDETLIDLRNKSTGDAWYAMHLVMMKNIEGYDDTAYKALQIAVGIINGVVLDE